MPENDGGKARQTDDSSGVKAEEALWQSGECFYKAFRASPVAMVISRLADGLIVDVNDAFVNLFEYDRKEVIGAIQTRSFYNSIDQRTELLFMLKKQGQIRNIEVRFKTKTGKVVDTLLSAEKTLINDEEYALKTLVDVTERKKLETSLKESEERFLLALKNTPVMVATLDRDLRFMWVYNLQAGYRPENLIGKPFGTGMTFENKEELLGRLNQVVEQGKPVRMEVKATGPAGDRVFDFYIEPKRKETGEIEGVSFTALNITERTRAQEALRSAMARLHLSLEASKAGTWEWNLETGENFWSEETWHLYGLKPNSVQPSYEAWLETVNPEDRSRAAYAVTEAARNGAELYVEYRLCEKNGINRWLMSRGKPVKNAQGSVDRYIGVIIDITERKKAEEALKQAQTELQKHAEDLERLVKERTRRLKDSERMAAIGETAGMVGHDICNPLQTIIGDLYLAKTDLASFPDSEEKRSLHESLDSIEKNSEYINKILVDLQDFAKPLNPRAEEIDLEAIIDDLLKKYGLPENIDAIMRVEREAAKVITDSAHIRRIMGNLVSNAVQAMPSGGKLAIEAYKDAGNTVITVSDTGVGIPEAVKPKLFQPLFTTKSKGQGFGLAVVKRMTEALSGTITFESEEGKGTKFIVRIPQKK